MKKPKAPVDLWQQMDKARVAISPDTAGCFTRSEYSARYGLTRGLTQSELVRLLAAGTIKRIALNRYRFVN